MTPRQAIRWLEAAHKAGFFATAQTRKWLRTEIDLTALRDRADFGRLVDLVNGKGQ